jgi:cell division protein FtsB
MPNGSAPGGSASRRAEQLEADNASLRRENEYLRQQRDILKKTLGILSEPPTSALNGLTR